MGSSAQGRHLACGCSEKGRGMGWALHSCLVVVDHFFSGGGSALPVLLCLCSSSKNHRHLQQGASAWSGGASRTCTASVSELGGGRRRWVPLSKDSLVCRAGEGRQCLSLLHGWERGLRTLEICGEGERSALLWRSASLLPLNQVVSAEALEGTLLLLLNMF